MKTMMKGGTKTLMIGPELAQIYFGKAETARRAGGEYADEGGAGAPMHHDKSDYSGMKARTQAPHEMGKGKFASCQGH